MLALLVQNDYFDLYVSGNDVLLKLKKAGYQLKSFDQITKENPRIKISSFPALRKALTDVGNENSIGSYLPVIELHISQDKLTAEITFNVTMEDFELNRDQYIKDAEKLLDDYGVVYGRKSLSSMKLLPLSTVIVAEGKKPQKGEDAKITYIEKPERKPVIREDGIADYYEMNFVTHIKEGQWLGEKIPPTDGIPGSDVFGNTIEAQRGADSKLTYDRKSVVEVEEQGKTVLKAMFGGALEFLPGDIVSVGQHLIINGDVGPETGSIKFEGAVTVYGTVLAGYSVNAVGDISIEGNESVTNAKEICSSEGDLYIKGGVFGGGTTIIEARGDIFIKHANNCKLFAQNIHVGFYMLGADAVAERIFVDKNKGKIIGGHIEALYRIECGYAGNQHERMTHLHAKGVNKDLIYSEIQQMAQELKDVQTTVSHLEQQLLKIEQLGASLRGEQEAAYEKLKETVQLSKDKIVELNQEIQAGMYKIRTAIRPQIEISKEAYPGVIIQIGDQSTSLNKETKGVFEVVDHVLNV